MHFSALRRADYADFIEQTIPFASCHREERRAPSRVRRHCFKAMPFDLILRRSARGQRLACGRRRRRPAVNSQTATCAVRIGADDPPSRSSSRYGVLIRPAGVQISPDRHGLWREPRNRARRRTGRRRAAVAFASDGSPPSRLRLTAPRRPRRLLDEAADMRIRENVDRRLRRTAELDPFGVITMGRLIRIGWAIMKSSSSSSVHLGTPKPSSAYGVLSRVTGADGPIAAISSSSRERVGGVLRYSTVSGSSPLRRIIASVLPKVPRSGIVADGDRLSRAALKF